MKNDNFVYINNNPYAVNIEFEFVDKATGRTTRIVDRLDSKDVATDTTARMKIGVGSKIELINAQVMHANGTKSSLMRPDAFGSINEILKHSVIIDIETLGKAGGSTITQLGAYDVGTGRGTMIVAQPQLVSFPEDAPDLKFKSRLGSYEAIPKGTTFKEIKYAETLIASSKTPLTFDESLRMVQSGAYDVDAVEKHLLDNDYFQGRYFATEQNLREALVRRGQDPTTSIESLRPIRTFMRALDEGMTEADLETLFKKSRGEEASLSNLFAAKVSLVADRSMKDILTKDLPSLLKGKVTWIANAAFESTQFGAQIDAEAKRAFDALNEVRVSQGMHEIKERNFMSRFSTGGYESEIATLNTMQKFKADPLLTKSPMLGVVSGISSSSGKPFYVTGKEYSEARASAFKSSNFSDLYDVFIKTTGAGDVRDILDLVRMQQSMLIEQGVISTSDRPASLSMEVQARVFGVTEALREGKTLDSAMQRMFDKELHIGLGDVRLSEYPVLRESLDQLEALNIVRQSLPGAEQLVSEAQQGRGALFRAQVYGKVMDRLNTVLFDEAGEPLESLQDVMFKQRAGRYALDLAETGTYDMRKYTSGYNVVQQAKQVAGVTHTEAIPIARSKVTPRVNFNELIEDMLALDDYKSARKETLVEDIKVHFEGLYDKPTGEITNDEEFLKRARRYSDSSSAQIDAIQARFEKGTDTGLREIVSEVKKENILRQTNVKTTAPSVLQKGRGFARNDIFETISKVTRKIPSKFKKGYLAAAGIFIAGSFLPKPKKKNIFIGDEESYLKANFKQSGYDSIDDFETALKARYNTFSGMSEKGIASVLRKHFTDFGSPYRSPEYSLSVLNDYKLRRERERYVSAQFGARHFSEEGDVGFFLKSFVNSLFRKELGLAKNSQSFLISGGRTVEAGKYNSLRGKNLLEYKVDDVSNITVEDADTITIRDTNNDRNLKVRLAGIDAPETAHQGRAAQPYAELAKQAAVDMISKAKDVRVVMQKGDSTYGRQVGMVYADGINVNLELLKRGAAAYLPYKSKTKPQIYDQKAFKEAQERAYSSKKGMWRESYFQAYKTVSDASGQSVTFNTLVNTRKVARNSNLMSMKSLMDQSQEMGIDNHRSLELADLGESIRNNKKPFSPDSMKSGWGDMSLQTYGESGNSILSILDRQKYEIGSLMRTRGSRTSESKNKASKVSKRNMELTSDVLAKNSHAEELQMQQTMIRNAQQRKIRRLETMQYMQQNALKNQFNSPIGHTRM